MAQLPTLHADEIALSYREGGTYRRAGSFGFLTNATVAAADTNQGLQDAVTNSVVHADTVPAKSRVNRTLTYGLASGEVTNARVLGLTAVEELVELTWLQNNDLFQDLLYA